jgi:DNA-binding XRE family transcriptional regulator
MAKPKSQSADSAAQQDPHALSGARENHLEVAIGREVRAFRQQLDMTVMELAKAAGLSTGMLSKIENGGISPSLSTLQALSRALHVPVTAFFRRSRASRSSGAAPAPAINTSCSATAAASASWSSPTSSP